MDYFFDIFRLCFRTFDNRWEEKRNIWMDNFELKLKKARQLLPSLVESSAQFGTGVVMRGLKPPPMSSTERRGGDGRGGGRLPHQLHQLVPLGKDAVGGGKARGYGSPLPIVLGILGGLPVTWGVPRMAHTLFITWHWVY